ncbi:hypothetical protein LTR86_007189 [Recurvomyces mirabilis]|nr:hypothetical protein LTR86_007189 [Recurvomyces mirabilis]
MAERTNLRDLGSVNGDIATQDGTESRLLELPPELRNRIYGYYLIERGRAIIITAALKQPAMLSVCRLIRSEALDIWYQCNDFDIHITDCDAQLLRSYQKHLKFPSTPLSPTKIVDKSGDKPGLAITVSGPHWENVLQWAHWAYQREARGPRCADSAINDTESVVCAIMDIAETAARDGLPWVACKTMIEGLRDLASRLDSRWNR